MKGIKGTIIFILIGLWIGVPHVAASNPCKLLPTCIKDGNTKKKIMLEYDDQNRIVKVVEEFEKETFAHIRHFMYNDNGSLDQMVYFQHNDDCKAYAIDFTYRGDTVLARYTNGNITRCILNKSKHLLEEISILADSQNFTRQCTYDDKGNVTSECTKGWAEHDNDAVERTYDCMSSYGTHVGVFSAVNIQPWVITLFDVGYSCANNRKKFEIVSENKFKHSDKSAKSRKTMELKYTYKDNYPEEIDYIINSDGTLEEKKVKIEYQAAR